MVLCWRKRPAPTRGRRVFGYHQHGMPDLKAADIVRDLPLLELAKHDAKEAVDKGLDFREELRHRFGGQFFERIYY